ncbi:MAG: hypothetical protein GX446_07830 [Chthonomonadales bacterium]|nr:hypothetical protein [Chthonomonadales bacterium]
MRINLDDPATDDEDPRLILDGDDDEPRLNLDDETAGLDEDAPDGFAIRRDPLAARRRRRVPKPLTPFQQRLIALGLILVIGVAIAVLGTYWRNVRSNAERIPASALSAPTTLQPPQPSGTGAMRPSGPLRAITPTPDTADSDGDRASDGDAPSEGIH